MSIDFPMSARDPRRRSVQLGMDESPNGKSVEDDLIEKFGGKVTDRTGMLAMIQKLKKDGKDKIANFLWRLLGPTIDSDSSSSAARNTADDDEENDEHYLSNRHGMDSRTGGRKIRPASPAARAMFEASIGMPSRRIRNLGN